MGVTVRQKPMRSGVWYVFLIHNRHRKSWKIGPRKEAEKFANVIRGRIALGRVAEIFEEHQTMLFKEAAKIWFKEIMPMKVKYSTQRNYESIYKRYITRVPFWNLPIDQITTGEVRSFLYKELGRKASSSVKHYKNCLSSVFSVAIERGIIEKNPALGIILNKPSTHHVKPFDRDEIAQLLDSLEGTDQYPFILLLVRTGARLGEALGLKWSDIDFENRIWHLQRNWVLGQESTPKSKRARLIDLSPQLVSVLENLDRKSDWVFPNQIGRPMDGNKWRRRQWYPILEKAGLRKVHPHSLRHSYVSLLIQAGANLVYIQRQCGHADITTTIGRYGHLMKQEGERPVDLLD